MSISKKQFIFELLINIALTAYVYFITESPAMSGLFLFAAYVISFVTKTFIKSHSPSMPAIFLFMVALVVCVIWDITIETTGNIGGTFHQYDSKTKHHCQSLLPENIAPDGWNEEVTKCLEAKQKRGNSGKELKNSANKFLNVFGKNVSSWKVTLYTFLVSWFFTILLEITIVIYKDRTKIKDKG